MQRYFMIQYRIAAGGPWKFKCVVDSREEAEMYAKDFKRNGFLSVSFWEL